MVILGLGSNIGDRQVHLAAAVRRLSALLQGVRFSRVLESPALLPPDAPPEFDCPYFNMAISGETELTPLALLEEIKTIEQALGRHPSAARGAAARNRHRHTTMDDVVPDTPGLAIPHRELLNRGFALLPLADVAPGWRYPGEGEHHGYTAAEIAAAKGFALGKNLRDTGLNIHG